MFISNTSLKSSLYGFRNVFSFFSCLFNLILIDFLFTEDFFEENYISIYGRWFYCFRFAEKQQDGRISNLFAHQFSDSTMDLN